MQWVFVWENYVLLHLLKTGNQCRVNLQYILAHILQVWCDNNSLTRQVTVNIYITFYIHFLPIIYTIGMYSDTSFLILQYGFLGYIMLGIHPQISLFITSEVLLFMKTLFRKSCRLEAFHPTDAQLIHQKPVLNYTFGSNFPSQPAVEIIPKSRKKQCNLNDIGQKARRGVSSNHI